MSQFKNRTFEVNKTERVGKNTWYRGTIDGKTIWIHSSYVNKIDEIAESKTSKLGKYKNSKAKIYRDLNLADYTLSGSQYKDAVYYIKKQAEINDDTFYLLSTEPSSTKGTIGWVNRKDLTTHAHTRVDNEKKTLLFKGTGKSYTKAWGGSKGTVYDDMSQFKNKTFEVNKTEKVGKNTWYRGTINGKTIWIHSSYVNKLDEITESKTSKLGHFKGSEVKIYKDLKLTDYTLAGDQYTHAVYYIKRQATINEDTLYLLSTEPSSSKGIIGWVKGKNLTVYDHTRAGMNEKKYIFKGTGKSYTKVWGGSKDTVYDDMSQFKNRTFEVNKIEKVGKNTWYRGIINGKTIWIHSSYVNKVDEIAESKTSKLGKYKNSKVKIYRDLNLADYTLSGSQYKDAVYYIKKQAKINDDAFYLLSTEPSSTKGTIGWVNRKDLTTHAHTRVDNQKKTLFFKGTGKSYTKAWGGSKDTVYGDMSQLVNKTFKVNKTEKVGKNIWYRGIVNGKTIWIHSSNVIENPSIDYDLTLDEAVQIQMKATPQTDLFYAYVSKKYIENNKTTSALNVRTGPSTIGTKVLGTLGKDTYVKIISEPETGWYQIEYKTSEWVNAAEKDLRYFLNPKNFIADEIQRFQFLDLSKTSDISVGKLNQNLIGKGILEGQGKAFIEASIVHNVNDIYLISHAFLETGNGSSTLARGVFYKGVKVYNMFGVGAYDSCPLDCGAKKAYEEGWTTPHKAIVGGAGFIGNNYIKKGQNTLYKMRWNPLVVSETKNYGKQYATDIGWASKQVTTMYNLYRDFGISIQALEIPVYK